MNTENKNWAKVSIPTPVVVVILFIISGISFLSIMDSSLEVRDTMANLNQTSARGVITAEQLVESRSR